MGAVHAWLWVSRWSGGRPRGILIVIEVVNAPFAWHESLDSSTLGSGLYQIVLGTLHLWSGRIQG